jgi:hypothetical protein
VSDADAGGDGCREAIHELSFRRLALDPPTQLTPSRQAWDFDKWQIIFFSVAYIMI